MGNMWKKNIVTVLIITVALTYPVIASDKSNPFNAEATFNNYVLPADHGYYLLCSGQIYFWSGDTQEMAMPLCGRPNCAHNSTPECSSIVRNASGKMFSVGDSIYLLSIDTVKDSATGEKGMPIWKVEKDGSGMEIACTIPQNDHNAGQYTIYQDRIYYPVRENTIDGSYQYSVWQMTLDGKEKKEVWKSELYNGGLTTLQGIGEWLYIWESGYEEAIDWKDESLDMTDVESFIKLNVFNPQTGEIIRDLYYDEEKKASPAIRDIYQDEIYMTLFDYDEMVQMVYKKSVNDLEEPIYLGTFPKETYTWDDCYGYTWGIRDEESETCWVEVYDYEGNLAQTIDIELWDDLHIVSADETYLFAQWKQVKYTNPEDRGGGSQDVLAVIEREKLKTNEAELITITKPLGGNSFER